MAKVYLSLGSNIHRYFNIQSALDALVALDEQIEVSSVYESEAVGFDGDHFLNLVVGMTVEMPLAEFSVWLKALEDRHGRDRQQAKFSGRTLDVDILTWDDAVGLVSGVQLPRNEITKNAFVLQPLAEIAGELVHPFYGISFSQLWQQFDQNSQNLWPVDFFWHDRQISISDQDWAS